MCNVSICSRKPVSCCVHISEPVSTTLLTGWRRSIWQGDSPVSLNKIIPKAGWDFVCTMLSCSITSRIQGHSDEGQNHLNTHFAAVPFFLSLDFSRKSPRHKQASMQTNKQSSKPCMHTQAVLIRGQTWLNELAAAADAASPWFCHLGNRAKTNRTAGHGSPDAVGATVYRRRPHTASTHKG